MANAFRQRLLQAVDQEPVVRDSIFNKRNPRDLPPVSAEEQVDLPPTAPSISTRPIAEGGIGDAPPPPTWQPIHYRASGQPEISPTAKGDPLEIQQREYDALQGWQPHGAKRGFKNSMKAGLMYAADAVRQNPDHPVEAAIAGFGTGTVGATAAPDFKNRLTREWKLRSSGKDLQNQLGLAKERSQAEAAGMVPVIIDGQVVQVPRGKSAQVALGSQRNALTERGQDITKTRDEARIKRWDRMSVEARRNEIGRLLRSGDLNSPELLSYATDALGLPEELKPHIAAGDVVVQVDKSGKVQLLNKRTNEATDTGITSYVTTKEKGRDERARQQRLSSRGNALIMAGRQVGALGDPADWEKQAVEADEDAQTAEEQAAELSKSNYPSDKVTARQYTAEAEKHRRQARDLRGNAIKAKGAQSGVSQFETDAPQPRVNTDLMPDKGKFDREKYIKTYQRLHKGQQPSQEMIKDAETRWTNP